MGKFLLVLLGASALAPAPSSTLAPSACVASRRDALAAGVVAACAAAPRPAAATAPLGAVLPLIELRYSIVEAQRSLESSEISAARSRILKLIASRELFRTVVAQNTQRYGADIDDVGARAKNELRVLRTADRVVAKLERAELALSQVRPGSSAAEGSPRSEAGAALAAALSGVESLLGESTDQSAAAEKLFVALRGADGDGDGVLSDLELASLPEALRRDAYEAQAVLADAAALSPKGDRLQKLNAGSRIFLGM